MEREQSIETLVVLGTSIIVFFVLLVVGFIIAHKRRLYVKESLIELLQNDCKVEVQKLKKEVQELRKENEEIKKELAELRKGK